MERVGNFIVTKNSRSFQLVCPLLLCFTLHLLSMISSGETRQPQTS
jgi:hypothetical protein